MMLEVIALVAQLNAPVGQDNKEVHEECLAPAQITEVYKSHGLTAHRLEGPELVAFNAAFAAQYHQPPPDDDLVLLIERGDTTLVFSFKADCMIGSGRTQTENIAKLLGAIEPK